MVTGWVGKVARRYRRRANELLDPVIGAAGRVRAMVPAIREVHRGERTEGARHAVYVHYDRWGVVHDYIHHAVRELADNGYLVTFVSNAPRLERIQIEPLLPMVREVVHRRNVGYDFAAYRDGIARLGDLDRVERLILVNDSVYGPVYPLSSILHAAEVKDADAVGITDSWEHHYHLQSYFMMFFPGALRSRAFQRFWRNFPTVGAKKWVIRNGELKLSNVLARSKLRLAALCPYREVARQVLQRLSEAGLSASGDGSSNVKYEAAYQEILRSRIVSGAALNPSHYFWDTLIVDWQCPFLKRELIAWNPAGVPRAWDWEELLRARTSYDTNLIVRHLQSL